MPQPRITSKLGAVLAAAVLLQSASAWSGISQMSAGGTLPTPFNAAGDALNRPVGFTAQAWIDTPNVLPSTIEFNLQFEFLPFQFVNVSGVNNIQANLNVFGAYAGVTFWGGPSVLGFKPFISGNLGGVYDYLYFPGATGSVTNSGAAFAIRAVPGFDLPIFNHVGVMVEMPITAAFFKNTLSIWETTFSLRWRL